MSAPRRIFLRIYFVSIIAWLGSCVIQYLTRVEETDSWSSSGSGTASPTELSSSLYSSPTAAGLQSITFSDSSSIAWVPWLRHPI